jgi:acyl-CoA thioester hydrolase
MDTPTAGPANRDSPPPEIVANDRGPGRNARRVRVRMYHTDLVGAVYHGTYFDLFEEARTEVFRALGYTYRDCVEGEGRIMIIVHAACDYLHPARMDDELVIAVQVEVITRARLTFVYDVSLGTGGKRVALGRQVFAFLDTLTQRPTSVPPRLAALIRATPEFGLISASAGTT